MSKQIMVDVKKCLACKSCEIACALEHSKSKEIEKAVTESPAPQRMVTVEAAGEFAVPIQCRHCEDALCIEICPAGAIKRENEQSPVIIDREMCIGCKLCVLICPLGVLQIGRQGRVIIKCDMCYKRAKEGKVPACVEACPTKALITGNHDPCAVFSASGNVTGAAISKSRDSAEKITTKEKGKLK